LRIHAINLTIVVDGLNPSLDCPHTSNRIIYYITTSYIDLRPITFLLRILDFVSNTSLNVLERKSLLILILTAPLIFVFQFAYCQPTQTLASTVRQIDGTLEIRVPDDFKSEAVDEPHIFKWAKDSAEIYVVVGNRLIVSRTAMINTFKKAANIDKTLEQIKTLRIPNAKGILIKEKPPSDSNRLMSWGLKIFTDKHEINAEFSAPGKDFKTYSPIFEEVIKSIKVVKSP